MNSYVVLGKVLGYKFFRFWGWPKILPLNLTVSLTYRCNSRCKTCYIWKKNTESELTPEEFEEIFKKLGEVYWLTLSGGEPFLRGDLVEICQSAYNHSKPRIINIPTNGLQSKIIPSRIREIIKICPQSKIIVNLSLDGIGKQNDMIRGVNGAYEKVLKTYKSLRTINAENFEVGIHTVISIFNVNELSNIYKRLLKLDADSYITEIAEERVELSTINTKITPSFEEYSQAINSISDCLRKADLKGTSKITQSLRLEYYNLVKKILKEKKQVIPCYAGFASAQIAPNGDVWTCCTRAESIGNLREVNYNFKEIWRGELVKQLRRSIIAGECYCPLANASYTNILCNFPSLLRVLHNLSWIQGRRPHLKKK